jgi:uncharacterized protein (DUF2147 family)
MKKMFNLLVVSVVFSLLFMASAFGQDTSIVGKWKTIDDKTNEPKSIVEVFEKDGKYFGQIKELFRKPGEDPDPVCDKCSDSDPRKDQPIKGMTIIQDMVKDGDKYSGGTIMDPKKGSSYKCKLWVQDGNLMVRGSVLFIRRTQTWYKAE